MGRQLVRFILLQVIDNNNRTTRLIPVLREFSPSDLGSIVAEDRGMSGTLFPRGNLLTILALEIDNIDLGIRSVAESKPNIRCTHILLGVPRPRQLGVQRGIHDVGLGDVEIVLSSERFNGRALEKWSRSINRTRECCNDPTYMFRSVKQINKLLS
jgi:hypothetical protein